MKITLFGFIQGIALLIGLPLINITNKFIFLALASVVIQSKLCKHCSSSFNMVSFMAVFPILILLFNNCQETYSIILAFSIILAISRISCFFAGCCTGKETEKNQLSLKYEGDYVVNRKLNKSRVYVKPTILIEIILQFIFIFAIAYSRQPLVLFGILNAILILLTDFWRMNKRGGNTNIVPLSVTSLVIFSVISVLKCNNFIKTEMKYKLSLNMVVSIIIIVILLSNDINFSDSSLSKENKDTNK